MAVVGLAQVDGKYPNLALMKLSAWHKAQGDDVALWDPLFEYDLVDVCENCIAEGLKVDFSQGLDIRLITPDHAKLLSRVRTFKQIHFAFDHVNHERAVRDGIAVLERNGVPRSRLMFYVLIGYDSTPEHDLYRVELLRGLGVDPFVMPYDRRDEYQRRFARWVNHKAIFKSVSWEKWNGRCSLCGGWWGAGGSGAPR